MPPNPPSKRMATPRVVSHPPPPKKIKIFGSNLMGQQHYKRVSEKIHVYLEFFERIFYHESG